MSIDAFRFAQSAKAALKAVKPAYFRGAVRGVADAKFEKRTREELAKQVVPEVLNEIISDGTPFSPERFRLWTRKLLTGLMQQLMPTYQLDEFFADMICEQFMSKSRTADDRTSIPCLKQNPDGRAIHAMIVNLLVEPCGGEQDAKIVAYAFMEQTWTALCEGRLGERRKVAPQEAVLEQPIYSPKNEEAPASPPRDDESSSYASSPEHDAVSSASTATFTADDGRPLTGWEAMLRQIRQQSTNSQSLQ